VDTSVSSNRRNYAVYCDLIELDPLMEGEDQEKMEEKNREIRRKKEINNKISE
jgi:hypothetical protein